jgi:CubicO group peptidase (beta-lactamase class C family)
MSEFPETRLLDSLVSSFMSDKHVVGASVAMAKEGKLVFAKGYGYTDKKDSIAMQPYHRFRIASISKLITAVGVMKLVEDSLISLEDYAFGNQGILPDKNFNDERIKNIKVKHLLTHTSGWTINRGDPVFSVLQIAHRQNAELPISRQNVVNFVLSTDLDHAPGSKYEYFNANYLILAEIIEQVSKLSYEEYIAFNLLEPLGLNDMEIGGSFVQERKVNEVSYYDYESNLQTWAVNGSRDIVPEFYGGIDISLLGPTGGWISSPVDLLRLVLAIDGSDDFPDILEPETIELMTKAYDNSHEAFIGWRGVDGIDNWWRTGTLPGSVGMVMRKHDGISWVILLNTSTSTRSIHHQLAVLMASAIYQTEQWPEEDLFNTVPENNVFVASRH